MLSKLFPKRVPQKKGWKPAIQPGTRIYAIGDVHGRLDLLEALLADIEADEAQRDPAQTQIIFLGDLVDRGPNSAQVIERLLRLEHERRGVRFLLGNHEEVFLSAVAGDKRALALFVKIGGDMTAYSYNISAEAFRESDYPELAALLQQHVPQSHLDFIEHFEDMIIEGDYAFVHAGIRPGEPLARQRSSDLRWIRREFTESTVSFEKMVVHGHSISTEIDLMHNRIGIDTGAYVSGILSAIGLEGDQRWFLQTGPEALGEQP